MEGSGVGQEQVWEDVDGLVPVGCSGIAALRCCRAELEQRLAPVRLDVGKISSWECVWGWCEPLGVCGSLAEVG